MIFAALALPVLAAFANAAAVPAVKRGDGALCYAGVHGISYNDYYGGEVLATACIAVLGDVDRSGMWTQRVCVAAAVAALPDNVIDLANCPTTVNIPIQAKFSSLDYNVYASIVGDCAWAEGGCPITKQNFIDLVYSELSNTGENVWPTSSDVLVSGRIEPVFNWTGFTDDQGVPYLNFNDWLHYSV